jgi:hypothetical protein
VVKYIRLSTTQPTVPWNQQLLKEDIVKDSNRQLQMFWITVVPKTIVQTLAPQEFWFHLPVTDDGRQAVMTQVTRFSNSSTLSSVICGSVHSGSQVTLEINKPDSRS